VECDGLGDGIGDTHFLCEPYLITNSLFVGQSLPPVFAVLEQFTFVYSGASPFFLAIPRPRVLGRDTGVSGWFSC